MEERSQRVRESSETRETSQPASPEENQPEIRVQTSRELLEATVNKTPPAEAGRTTAAISTGPRTISRITATRAAFLQCTSYSVRPLYPRDSGEDGDFHAPLMYATPPCDYKRRRRAPLSGL